MTTNNLWSPMLAGEAVLGNIKYPKIAMPKLNGVRACNQQGALLARSLKPIRNDHTRNLFSGRLFDGCDGELIVGDFSDEEVFARTTSGVMSKEGTPEVAWYLFDYYQEGVPYRDRLTNLARIASAAYIADERLRGVLFVIPHRVIVSDTELLECSDWALADGCEGLVLRDPEALYKEGRSTDLEGGFLRLCPWHRSEGVILEIHERMVNNNPRQINELGRTKRSSHKANKVSSGRAGAVTIQDVNTNIVSRIAVPTEVLQADVMQNPEQYVGKLLKYKFKPPVKKGGLPRFAQWEGIRSPFDL